MAPPRLRCTVRHATASWVMATNLLPRPIDIQPLITKRLKEIQRLLNSTA
jgi:hypothetical protein